MRATSSQTFRQAYQLIQLLQETEAEEEDESLQGELTTLLSDKHDVRPRPVPQRHASTHTLTHAHPGCSTGPPLHRCTAF